MGWTHNWLRDTELPPEAFSKASTDCARLLGSISVPLTGPDGTRSPIFRAEAIAFNGTGRGACEPFEIHRVEFDRHGRSFVRSFCKTEHLPYDLCVQLALIILKHHLADAIRIGSDGRDADWRVAARTCQAGLAYGTEFHLDKDR